MTDAPKVAICTPYYRTVEAPMFLSAMSMGFACGGRVAAVGIGTSGCYIEDNRNGCVEYALNMEKQAGFRFDWLLWLDSDMQFPPDALLRLLAHDKDIVGVNYRQRTPPYAACGVYADHTDNHLMEPGLHRMEQLPTGLLLTRCQIYREMGYPWFRPGLRNEPRDDIYFCRQVRSMGYDIWCDHDLSFQVVHHDNGQAIPWFRPDQIVRHEGGIIDNDKAAEAGRERAALSGRDFRVQLKAEMA